MTKGVIEVLDGAGKSLFAVVDPSARFTGDPMVAERRFVAFMRPFQDEAAAREALSAAGAVEGLRS